MTRPKLDYATLFAETSQEWVGDAQYLYASLEALLRGSKIDDAWKVLESAGD